MGSGRGAPSAPRGDAEPAPPPPAAPTSTGPPAGPERLALPPDAREGPRPPPPSRVAHRRVRSIGGRDDGLPGSPHGASVTDLASLTSLDALGGAGRPRHRRRGSRESVGAVSVASAASAHSLGSERSDSHHTVRSGFYLPPAPSLPRRWTRGDGLGSGSFGSVHLGLNSDTGELFAVKEVVVDDHRRDRSRAVVEQLAREVETLSRLQHPNIVRYVGVQREPESVLIFLEYVPGGSIAGLLERFGPLEESVARVYAPQILVALDYLHAHRTVHRDVKGANVLVEKSGRIKLADFGMAKTIVERAGTTSSGGVVAGGAAGGSEGSDAALGDPSRAGSGLGSGGGKEGMAGSAFWMAPEVVRQQAHGAPADVWSMGCTVIEMLTGAPPWSDCGGAVQAIFKIASTRESPSFPEDVGVSADARSFVDACTRRDPTMRPTAEALLTHPFVTSGARGGGGDAGDVPALQYEGYWSDDDDDGGGGGDGGERGTLGKPPVEGARGRRGGASAGGRVPPSREASARTVGSASSVRVRDDARGDYTDEDESLGGAADWREEAEALRRRFENLDDGEDDEEAGAGAG